MNANKKQNATEELARVLAEFGEKCDGGSECHFEGDFPVVSCELNGNVKNVAVYAARVKDGSITLLVKECGGAEDYPSEASIDDVESETDIMCITRMVVEE